MKCEKRLLLVMSVSAGAGLMSGQDSRDGPIVIHESYHDKSAPIREYGFIGPQPLVGPRVRPLRSRFTHATAEQPDRAVQSFLAPLVSAKIGLNFDSVGDAANGGFAFAPSGTNLAVGATQVVQVINTAYQVLNKTTGASVFGRTQVSSIFIGVAGLCGQGAASHLHRPHRALRQSCRPLAGHNSRRR